MLHDPIYGAYTEIFGGLSPDVNASKNGSWSKSFFFFLWPSLSQQLPNFLTQIYLFYFFTDLITLCPVSSYPMGSFRILPPPRPRQVDEDRSRRRHGRRGAVLGLVRGASKTLLVKRKTPKPYYANIKCHNLMRVWITMV
jgi:hypothetical protein